MKTKRKKEWICNRCGAAREHRGHRESISFCLCGAPNNESHRAKACKRKAAK